MVLNTTCTVVPGGCSGAMLDWLKADLAANKLGCTVVMGHSPYLSSAAPSYGTPDLSAIWPTLVLNDVDLFVAGHSHAYERLARVRTQGNVDEDWGPGDGDDGHAGVPIVIAGTGGHSLIPFGRIHPASRSRVAGRYGILKIVPNYPSLGRWVQAFKTTDGQTLIGSRCGATQRPAWCATDLPGRRGSSPRPGLALGISGRGPDRLCRARRRPRTRTAIRSWPGAGRA